jgi:nucleotide-binding universal stress UspA family protein
MITTDSTQLAIAPGISDPQRRPRKVLTVIDGSERAGRVIDYALTLNGVGKPLDMILLVIVRTPPDGRLRGYGSFKRDEVHANLKEHAADRIVSAASRRFEQAGIGHRSRIEIGEPAETILEVARDEGADMILIGEAPAGVVQRWLPKAIGLSLATTAILVAQQARMPVAVIK